jgi:hypothetical protein
MNECLICLEPCQETMKCCNGPIHVGCIGDLLEKGYKECPHCKKEMYTVEETQPLIATVVVTKEQSNCQVLLEGLGVFTLMSMLCTIILNSR